ncbi:MAG: DUF6713 family protein [Pseudomonadota bacterium]
MKAARDFSLLIAIALLMVHEMDAVTHAEWRLLPVLSGFEDAMGREAFILLHIPLYVFLLWGLFLSQWKQRAALIVTGLIALHAIVHFLLSGHQLYTFAAPIETITVYGAGLFSLIYWVLFLRTRSE